MTIILSQFIELVQVKFKGHHFNTLEIVVRDDEIHLGPCDYIPTGMKSKTLTFEQFLQNCRDNFPGISFQFLSLETVHQGIFTRNIL